MSGIYIKGMEMPKNCEECSIKSWDTEDYVCPFSGISTLCISRQNTCPLVAVPDHGRLIDADAVDYDDYWWNKHYSARDCKQAEKMIKEQPTIIPADKDGET